jgi:23S rRNA pseudouridine1911/1915/1917 synthase
MEDFEILYSDDDILVTNKISPIPVQKDKSGDEDLQTMLAFWLRNKGKVAERPSHANESRHQKHSGVFLEAAHRIDRRTSGIVVFARNQASLRILEKMFQDRSISKTYLACVEREPVPPSGKLENLLIQDKRSNRAIAKPILPAASVEKGKRAKTGETAILDYSLVAHSDRYFFLSIEPKTGRHHQIRAQLAAMGWPIKGDLKYGARRSNPSGRILLHAWKIEFHHPKTNDFISLTANPPSDETLWEFLLSQIESNAITDSTTRDASTRKQAQA